MILKIIILIIILYLIIKNNNKQQNISDAIKLKHLENDTSRIQNNKKILNIIFDQELKYYNPEAYNECVEYIDAFLEKYDFIKIDPRRASFLYNNMLDDKKYIINSLLSITMRIPTEYNLKDVINDMDETLDEYLLEVYNIYQQYLNKSGYDYTTNMIYLNHPDPYNIDENIIEPGKKLLFNRV